MDAIVFDLDGTLCDSLVPIFEANRHIIGDDPDLIHPGTVLRLPSDF